MESHSQVRFTDTPPDSPKSCMKGSRRINFAEPSDEGPSEPVAPKSPKRSTKTVVIKSPGSSTTAAAEDASQSEAPPVQKRPAEIQFQFHLSQHYEQSTPPPNCTSNGGSHYEDQSSPFPEPDENSEDDPKQDPQLMEIASKFVNEIIEKAKVEAASRQKVDPENDARARPMSSFRAVAEDFLGGRTPWYRRAHGAISKWITNLCVRAQNSIRT